MSVVTQIESALKEISKLIDADPEPETPDGERLKSLVDAVVIFEFEQFPIFPPEPTNVLKFRIEKSARVENGTPAEAVIVVVLY